LFPNHTSTWDRFEGEKDVDESIIDGGNVEANALKDEETNVEEKKDKVLEAVDCGCSGLVFLRFRINVKPTDFVQKLIGRSA
jgi:6-phosphogluconate dehydrogenase (decarboxylating)